MSFFFGRSSFFLQYLRAVFLLYKEIVVICFQTTNFFEFASKGVIEETTDPTPASTAFLPMLGNRSEMLNNLCLIR